MEWFVKAFLKSSLMWLAVGVTFGVCMAAHPVWTVYRQAHLHMLLLGFVAMMIYGVAYHVIPRFTAHPLHSRRAPAWQWWLANVGLVLMVAGFVVRATLASVGTPLLVAGGILAAVSAYMFAYVMWRTIDGSPSLRANEKRAADAATQVIALSARRPADRR